MSLGSDIDGVTKLSMILVALRCKIGSCVSVYGIEVVKRYTNQEKHGQKCVTSGDKHIWDGIPQHDDKHLI